MNLCREETNAFTRRASSPLVADRPTLPMALQRQVKVEAGHRCAIPTCRSHPIELAHIDPRKPDGSNDVFENLIALCPNCHTRYDRGEIDRPAMRQYKANLSVLNHRYGDLERRVLQAAANRPQLRHSALKFPGGFGVLLQYLLEDGLLVQASPPQGEGQMLILGAPTHEYFALTDAGRAFIDRWLRAEDLEQT
jgi:hypothetical protein